MQSVRDVLLAARSNVVGVPSVELKPVPAAWFADEPLTTSAQIPAGEFIAEVFLNQGRLGPNRVILADQAGGLKTYREVIAAICARMPDIARLPGTHVGIMLPASAAEGVIYLATLFAGKTLVIKRIST